MNFRGTGRVAGAAATSREKLKMVSGGSVVRWFAMHSTSGLGGGVDGSGQAVPVVGQRSSTGLYPNQLSGATSRTMSLPSTCVFLERI